MIHLSESIHSLSSTAYLFALHKQKQCKTIDEKKEQVNAALCSPYFQINEVHKLKHSLSKRNKNEPLRRANEHTQHRAQQMTSIKKN